ncbi:hypothetical protein COW36_24730 [bacterium (Candidatus Blackallbacteria) CG17_big_fil_post_rev_8_21_14_2_50_48_46]|uniref:Flagellar assembly protein T N-terminal domain-containing protein n=1 Tax=bacterium (Candidatus Blackallbacteria) CG17_big_fil_post_rev_8_21_14_2_50_48_46 TaxID=2014261 RepID=A0A2M7FXC6_9BACT|nr:MAG: hypothetical protein COW64_19670 [bacterium (Candidatus Blackallbacteria) CG18_big_fil_WC_8_21_14_2_50_49_26]PIW13874.1 MAG: hypothetical protein COW36_24730 [bacterium (Candidatus Blackallbacteria) CG17_big_fil_post_rev_8_21_14_2_50_48_46]PIW45100.1 MAG: hypothetical protein COW20_22360 [bacterium (Candidatus Blackallbacteria) CG13_big_fil_rev_8_21_14_2_50_49_14]
MHKFLSYCLGLALLCASLGVAPAVHADVKNLDYAVKELETMGVGSNADAAMADAEMKALQAVVDTLVQTDAERQAFAKVQEQVFAQREKYIKRLKILSKGSSEGGGRYYKIRYEVQVQTLRSDLEKAGIISSTKQLSSQLKFPTIMAYYKDPAERSNYAQWSVDRINNYLLEQQFKVVDGKVMQGLQKDDQVVAQSAGSRERLSQALALKAKADFYMRIEIDPKVVGRSGDYTYVQSPVLVQAFESSSGSPFISKSYQRLDGKGQPEALAVKGSLDVSAKIVIEESVAGVMPLIVEDLLRHWKQNVAQGNQYRLVVKGLKGSQKSQFEAGLREHVRDLKLQSDGAYLVRYSGVLGDLADLLEESLQAKIGLAVQQFDLGSAYFTVSR